MSRNKGIKMPKVTVLMPVYNGEKYLREAIDSILNQTFTDLEFLIINDGSTDNSEKIIKTYNDKRIKLINNETNLKIAATLNKGIELSQGEYIARMDADDISLPNRLEIQVKYMDSHPDIGVCGSWYKNFGLKKGIIKLPENNTDIKASMLFLCPVCHPTVLFRKNLFNNLGLKYRLDAINAEDYYLWLDAALKNVKFKNLQKVLVNYRAHLNQIGYAQTNEQLHLSSLLRLNFLKSLGISLDEFEQELFESFALKRMKTNLINFKNLALLLSKILKAAESSKIIDSKALKSLFIINIRKFIFKNLLINIYLVWSLLKLIFNKSSQ